MRGGAARGTEGKIFLEVLKKSGLKLERLFFQDATV